MAMYRVAHSWVGPQRKPRQQWLTTFRASFQKPYPTPAGCGTCIRLMMAWCTLHMLAREELSTWISTAWMGPAGLKSVTATCNI